MIDSVHHVELDGVRYRLAESAEGEHHVVSGQPLRPPNAVTVQGVDSGQKFQARPDMLLWSWTDWSGGEGQRVWDPSKPNRSWQLSAVRAFDSVGHLSPGYYVETTTESTATDIAGKVALALGAGGLFHLRRDTGKGRKWDEANGYWGAEITMTGITGSDMAVGDQGKIYFIEESDDEVYKWDGTTDGTTLLSNTLIQNNARYIEQLGDYCYVYKPSQPAVYEIPKDGLGNATAIDEWTEDGEFPEGRSLIATLNGRVYVAVADSTKTFIREVTPTTAAGSGFGSEIARLSGFTAEGMWSHSGALFLLGRYDTETASDVRTILYLIPGGSYGTLGKIREGVALGEVSGGQQGGGRFLDHFFVTKKWNDTYPNHALFQVDAVTGGYAMVAYDETGDCTGERPAYLVVYEGDIFWTTGADATTPRILRADPSRYQSYGEAISAEHDFDYLGTKYLGSLTLACEPLPANWTVYVDYQKDGDGTWTNAITYTTTSGTGETAVVSTDTSTVQFRQLKMRIRFSYGGGGVPSSGPIVSGVEARAGVTEKVNVFTLLLDLADDDSAGSQSKSGYSKVVDFLTSAVKETVVDFKDGYVSGRSGEYNQYDVVVDKFDVVLDRPGEGIGVVRLREVV